MPDFSLAKSLSTYTMARRLHPSRRQTIVPPASPVAVRGRSHPLIQGSGSRVRFSNRFAHRDFVDHSPDHRSALQAVDHVSFHVCQGETLGLIGESGCGKSTLGRTLIGLIGSRKGEIQYRGESVTQLKGKQLNEYRQKVQFIFQDPFSSLNPTLKIGPSIMEVMRVHGMHSSRKQRQEAALGLLDNVGLPGGFFNRYPHEFSGGQRQRIGLARALATGPELIICDESVSSLDVSVQAQILNLLNELKEKLKLTYLFISHDLAVVKHMADRIMVMKDGKLVEQGPSNELFQNPESDYTRELLDSILD